MAETAGKHGWHIGQHEWFPGYAAVENADCDGRGTLELTSDDNWKKGTEKYLSP
jgi:hypothetical protein